MPASRPALPAALLGALLAACAAAPEGAVVASGTVEATEVDVAPLAPGQVYQVWLIRPDNTRVSAGVFTVDASQRATLVIHAPGTWSAYQGMGITVEPGPAGSPGPLARGSPAAR